MDAQTFLLITGAPQPAVRPRGPLPPFPPGHYDRDPPRGVPTTPDKLWYRGNFCGIRVPGVPLLPGMAGFTVKPWNENRADHAPPFMALDIPRYFKHDPSVADEILRRYAERGYTHLQCSVGHAIEAGLSKEDYIAYAARVRSFGLFADHWFLGAMNVGLNTRDQDRDYWDPILTPWFDALLSNGVIDCACVGWQLDGFNTPDPNPRYFSPIQSIIDLFADRLGPHGIPIGTHWLNEAGAWNRVWFPDHERPGGGEWRTDRFKWWQDQRNKLSWFHHQGDVDLDIGTYQAKLVDTLEPFGNGRMGRSGLFGDRPFGLIVFECSGQAQFDLKVSEDEGDLRGYLLCCTKAAAPVSGYGNGARRPDGSTL